MEKITEKHYLNELLSYLNMNESEFATSIGENQSKINNILNFRNGISSKMARTIIVKYKNVSFEWLRKGEGEMLNNTKEVQKNDQIFSVSEYRQRGYSPYYSETQVSTGKYDLMLIEQSEEPQSWIKIPNATVDVWFPIIGCSMEPKIYAGDTIGVVRMHNWDRVDPDKLYLIITIDDRMVKYIEPDEENPDILWGVSLNHPKIRIYKNEIRQLHRVVWAGRLV